MLVVRVGVGRSDIGPSLHGTQAPMFGLARSPYGCCVLLFLVTLLLLPRYRTILSVRHTCSACMLAVTARAFHGCTLALTVSCACFGCIFALDEVMTPFIQGFHPLFRCAETVYTVRGQFP